MQPVDRRLDRLPLAGCCWPVLDSEMSRPGRAQGTAGFQDQIRTRLHTVKYRVPDSETGSTRTDKDVTQRVTGTTSLFGLREIQ